MEKDEDIRELAARALAEGIDLIDVRPAEQYAAGHIPGAVNIPWDETDNHEIRSGSYLYCRTGHKAGIVRNRLLEQGIETVNIGGIESDPHTNAKDPDSEN